MKKENKKPSGKIQLRQRAEEKLKKGDDSKASTPGTGEPRRLLDELLIHQVELEMQNEELRVARDQAEAATERFESLYDFAPAGYFTLENTGTITKLNRSGAKLLGKEVSALEGSNFRFFISQDTLPVFNDFTDRVFATKCKQNCEVRLELKGCPAKSVYMEGVVPGNEEKCLLSVIDITDLRKIEEQLEDSETRFRTIYEGGPIGMALIGLDYRFLMANDMFCRMTGYSEDELKRMPAENLSHPDFFSRNNANIQKLVRGEIPVYRTEKQYIRKDKTHFWGSLTLNVNYTSDGNIRYLIAMIEDISERKRAQEELIETQTLYTQFIERSPIYTYIKESSPGESRVIQASDNFKMMTGLNAKDMAGKTMKELFPPDFAAKITADDWDVVSGGEVLTLDEELNGRKYSTIKFPIKSGNKTLLAGYTIDTTEGKQAEKEIINLNEELEHLVLERTIKLQAVNKELAAFSYSASHEIRTPLRALNGFAHILLDDYSARLDDEGKRLLQVIIDNANQMGQLIDDLLSVYGISRKEVKLANINMYELAYSVYGELMDIGNKERIHFHLQDIPDAYGDRDMLRVVWTNLIGNAIKFSSGKAICTIDVGFVTGKAEIIYYIRDNGIGFNVEHADKLFGLFKSLHNRKDFEGSGIGLSVVQHIIDLHGGRVWAEGKENEGATFYFTLPLKI